MWSAPTGISHPWLYILSRLFIKGTEYITVSLQLTLVRVLIKHLFIRQAGAGKIFKGPFIMITLCPKVQNKNK